VVLSGLATELLAILCPWANQATVAHTAYLGSSQVAFVAWLHAEMPPCRLHGMFVCDDENDTTMDIPLTNGDIMVMQRIDPIIVKLYMKGANGRPKPIPQNFRLFMLDDGKMCRVTVYEGVQYYIQWAGNYTAFIGGTPQFELRAPKQLAVMLHHPAPAAGIVTLLCQLTLPKHPSELRVTFPAVCKVQCRHLLHLRRSKPSLHFAFAPSLAAT
jgi:hypothetical protein